MKSFTQITTAAFFTVAAAQYSINPNSVDNSTRRAWCLNQQTQCPLICLQTAGNSATVRSNTCDWQTLTYSCVCSNGLSPNVSEYSQTLPYYICTAWGTQCVANCGAANSACQAACQQDHPCGAQNPTRQNTSTISSTSSAAASGSSTSGLSNNAQSTDGAGQTVYQGFAGQTTAASTSQQTGAAAAVQVWALGAGQTFGSLAVLGALFGGFAVLL